MSLPPTLRDDLDMALDLAANFRPLNASELEEAKTLASGLNPIFKA
jgi:hypothetical protein